MSHWPTGTLVPSPPAGVPSCSQNPGFLFPLSTPAPRAASPQALPQPLTPAPAGTMAGLGCLQPTQGGGLTTHTGEQLDSSALHGAMETLTGAPAAEGNILASGRAWQEPVGVEQVGSASGFSGPHALVLAAPGCHVVCGQRGQHGAHDPQPWVSTASELHSGKWHSENMVCARNTVISPGRDTHTGDFYWNPEAPGPHSHDCCG